TPALCVSAERVLMSHCSPTIGTTRPHARSFSFFFQSYPDPRDLHSFPTRRSSDLSFISSTIRATPSAKARWMSGGLPRIASRRQDRKSTRLNSSHSQISYAVFCLKKKKKVQYESTTLRR